MCYLYEVFLVTYKFFLVFLKKKFGEGTYPFFGVKYKKLSVRSYPLLPPLQPDVHGTDPVAALHLSASGL